jgi:DNA-binding transcriptional ArsR family regulator
MIAAMPLPSGAEMPRRVLSLTLPRVAKEILIQLHCWKVRKRYVDPSVETLARLVQASPRTVQRHLRELADAGLVFRAYNGGRAKRCIYYVGKSAAEALANAAPGWEEKCHLGSLRLGRAALAKLERKGDKIVTLTADHSSRSERSDRDHRCRDALPSEESATVQQFGEVARPPTPLAGGADNAEHGPARPPEGSQTQDPPNPPTGGKGGLGTKRSGGGRARIWKTDPALWRLVWGLWDSFFRAYRPKAQRIPDIRDAVAMSGLIREALFAARQSEPEAIRYLAWGFRQHLRERPRDPLWLLRKTRSSYGWPKSGWAVPTREDFERWHARARAPEPEKNIAPASNLDRGRQLLERLKPR